MMLPLERPAQHRLPPVPGLSYIPELVPAEEAAGLLAEIDQQPWLSDLQRRVQHYGYRYEYKSRTVKADAWLGPLPDWLHALSRSLAADDRLGAQPEQVIVNEYLPGQGISRHVDCVPCFGPRIAILSLGSPCLMQFTHVRTTAVDTVLLEERSLLVLSGPARYDWQHAIPGRKSDLVDGIRVARGRRVSVTFRTVRL